MLPFLKFQKYFKSVFYSAFCIRHKTRWSIIYLTSILFSVYKWQSTNGSPPSPGCFARPPSSTYEFQRLSSFSVTNVQQDKINCSSPGVALSDGEAVKRMTDRVCIEPRGKQKRLGLESPRRAICQSQWELLLSTLVECSDRMKRVCMGDSYRDVSVSNRGQALSIEQMRPLYLHPGILHMYVLMTCKSYKTSLFWSIWTSFKCLKTCLWLWTQKMIMRIVNESQWGPVSGFHYSSKYFLLCSNRVSDILIWCNNSKDSKMLGFHLHFKH